MRSSAKPSRRVPRNNFTILISVALLLLSRGATAAIPAYPAQDDILAIGNVEGLRGSVWGAFAITSDGDTLVNVNGGVRMLPASNMKLVTTGAALCRLGPDFRFSTRLACSGEMVDSTLVGDVFIVGGGDPSLCDHYRQTGDSLETFISWREMLLRRGIRSVNGRIVADNRYFDGDDILGDWSIEDICTDYSSGASGLSIADNLSCDAEQAPFHCASEFSFYLNMNGIPVSGSPSAGTFFPVDSMEVLGVTESVSLATLIDVANHESENIYAEALFRQMGKAVSGSSSYDSSRKALTGIINGMGISTSGVRFADGSGLSRKNYVTPEFMAAFLRKMSGTKDFAVYFNSLPGPGTGTLKYRLSGQPESLRSRIYMKSGTMTGVRCFSGYILPSKNNSGNMIAFSIMFNNFLVPGSVLAPIMDEMIVRLAAEN